MSELEDDVRALDRALQGLAPPPDLEAKVLQRIDGTVEPPRSRGVLPGWALAGLAFAAGVAAVVLLRSPPQASRDHEVVLVEPEETAEPRVMLDGRLTLREGCEATPHEAGARLAAGCRARVDEPRIEVEAWAPSTISIEDDRLTLREGTVLFHVAPLATGAKPVRVGVPGGSIEVVGTRFVVSAGSGGGTLDLLEGAVRFHRDDEVTAVTLGERHAWGSRTRLEPTPPEIDEAESPRPPRVRPGPDPDLAPALAEVARLRQRGRYAEAVKRLRALGKTTRSQHAREVISFEEGTLIEKFRPTKDVCAHWARHTTRFGKGSYAAEIDRRRSRLGCE